MGKLKKKSYKILSNKKCIECGKNLKQNLIDKNPDAEYCWEHYPKSKNNKAELNDYLIRLKKVGFPIKRNGVVVSIQKRMHYFFADWMHKMVGDSVLLHISNNQKEAKVYCFTTNEFLGIAKEITHSKKISGDNRMVKNEVSLVEEANAAFPNTINDLEAMDLYAKMLHKKLRELADIGQDSGKEYNSKKRKYRKVRDEYLELRKNLIEQESSMKVVEEIK